MKKLKIYVLALFFFSFLKINAGCCGDIKICNNSSWNPILTLFYNSPIYTLEFDPTDTFMVRSNSCGCMDGIAKIWYNDSLFFEPLYMPKYLKLSAKPGKYRIKIELGAYGSLEATIIIANKLLHVGVNEYLNTNEWVSLFPNPSKESVTINSFNENLKTVAIYNVNSELIEFIETESKTLTIPLSQYPQGIYIVKVATLSNKIAIKKLIVSN